MSEPRPVHQLVAALSAGDAISNEALAIRDHLRKRGRRSDIFAERTHTAMVGEARPLTQYPGAADGAICFFHFSIGSAASSLAYHRKEPLVCVYHNITPAEFFIGFHDHLAGLCHHGRRELETFAGRAQLGLGDSEYNRRELEAAGFRATGVLPIVFDWKRYDEPANPIVPVSLEPFEGVTVLFVSRVVPNKRFEDVIAAFAAFQRLVPNSRLVLAGDSAGQERYLRRLLERVSALGARRVVFTGHIEQADLHALYGMADVFLCLSRHEGFGVPLVEAMLFGVPVVALDATAVRETLDGGGALLSSSDPDLVAEVLRHVVNDGPVRRAVLDAQRRALARRRATDFGTLLDAQIARLEAAL